MTKLTFSYHTVLPISLRSGLFFCPNFETNMALDKIAEEWMVMRYFREKCAEFPKGKLTKSESPDFILQLNRKKSIGIELTRFISNNDEIVESVSVLLDLVIKKEEKLRIYQKNLCQEYWLIIATETIDSDTLLGRMNIPKSRFDKLFVFDLFSGQIMHF